MIVDVTASLIADDVEQLRALAYWDGFARVLFSYMEEHPEVGNPNFDLEGARRRWRRTVRRYSKSLRQSIDSMFLHGVYDDTDCYDPFVEGREPEEPELTRPATSWARLLLAALDPGVNGTDGK